MAARSKASVWSRPLVGLLISIPAGSRISVCCVCVACCQILVSASDSSLIQRNPTECGVSECDRAASIMSRPWHTRGCRAKKKIK